MTDIIINTLHYAISFIFIISIIVFVHEFGHYYIAKISGVKITDFSIGFGKVLFSRKDKHGTMWKVCAIPMGGYVKFLGDTSNTSTEPDIEQVPQKDRIFAFHTKTLPIKAAIVAAGPIFNFLFSIIILTIMLYTNGVMSSSTVINKVIPDSAAHKAGLIEGDQIIAIDNLKVDSFFEIERIISIHPNIPLNMTVYRSNKSFNLTVTPQPFAFKSASNNEMVIGKIGVQSMGLEHKKLNLLESGKYAVSETFIICKLTLKAIGQMFTGQRSYKEIEGPIGIAKMAGDSAKKGFEYILWLIALLSINLGLINLLPIPMLDGGHLLFYVIEIIAGKKAVIHMHKIAMTAGLILIASLSALAIINDINNIKLF
jgi:regulator of sigma E protease